MTENPGSPARRTGPAALRVPLLVPPAAAGLPRTVVLLVGAAAAVIVVAGLHSISGLVAPAFLALVLTVTVNPLRGWLTRHRVPSLLATLAVIVTVYAILLALALSLLLAVASLADLLPRYEDDLRDLASDTAERLAALGVHQEQLDAAARAIDPGKLVTAVAGVFSSLLSVLTDLFFIVTLLLFLAVDAVAFPAVLRSMGPAHNRFAEAMARFAAGTRRYLVVSTVFGLIVALLDVALLYWLDIPVPWLWGLIAFVTNYIPNIGFVVGLVPPALLGLLEHGWTGALGVVVGYCVLNVVIQSVIQPRFVGQAVGLSTTLTFLSLVFWAWVFGALGALLAIPFSLFARALLVDPDPRARWLVPLLTGGPDQPDPPERPGSPPVTTT
jgi:AI-2 transport protein TqsA